MFIRKVSVFLYATFHTQDRYGQLDEHQPYPRINSAWKKKIKELKFRIVYKRSFLKKKAELQVFNTPEKLNA